MRKKYIIYTYSLNDNVGKKIILIIDSVLKYEVSSQYLYCSKCHVKEHLRS